MHNVYVFLHSIYNKEIDLVEVSLDYVLKDFFRDYCSSDVQFVYNVQTETLLNPELSFHDNQVVQADHLIYG